MIVRIWHGRTSHDLGNDYAKFLQQRAIPDYRGTPGNQGALALRSAGAQQDEFLTVSLWQSMDVIRGFAGAAVDVAKYYDEDSRFLLEFEPTVVHYEVVGAELAPELDGMFGKAGDD